MFDVGFWELALIGVVALLVVGPDRLPGMARNVGLWVGRIRRYVGQVRDDIEREIRAEELREMMDKSKQLGELHDVVEETRGTMGEARRELESAERGAGEEAEGAAQPPAGETKGEPRAREGEPDPTGAADTVGDAARRRDAATEPAGEGASGSTREGEGVSPAETVDDDERRTQ